MEYAELKHVFGVGQYEARWVARSFLVRLTARGILPCSNYVAQLEKRAERVTPPNWNMAFFVSDTCEKGLVPFETEVFMVNNTGAQAITVFDAVGEHEVPIWPAFGNAENLVTLGQALGNAFVVYADIWNGTTEKTGCVVVPEGSPVIATKALAFGPESRENCDAFVLKHCSAKPQLILAGGEIPWPLIA